MKIILTLIACLFVTSAHAAEEDPSCFSPVMGFNVCDAARKLQAAGATMLPQKMNANLTIVSVIAAGPRLIFTAMWRLSKADMEATQQQGGFTRDQWSANIQQATQNSVCSGRATAAFVRLGGQVQYLYMTSDGFRAFEPLVERCPDL
jgi:hypothetical protein